MGQASSTRRAPRARPATATSPRSATSCGRAASSRTCRWPWRRSRTAWPATSTRWCWRSTRARRSRSASRSRSATALSIEAERDALVARLRAFTPLVRGTSAGARRALHPRRRCVPPHLLEPAAQPGAVRDLQRDGRAGADAPRARRGADLDPRGVRRPQGADRTRCAAATPTRPAPPSPSTPTASATALATFLADDRRRPLTRPPTSRSRRSAQPARRLSIRVLDMRCTCVAYYARRPKRRTHLVEQEPRPMSELCEAGHRRRRPVPDLARRDARRTS